MVVKLSGRKTQVSLYISRRTLIFINPPGVFPPGTDEYSLTVIAAIGFVIYAKRLGTLDRPEAPTIGHTIVKNAKM